MTFVICFSKLFEEHFDLKENYIPEKTEKECLRVLYLKKIETIENKKTEGHTTAISNDSSIRTVFLRCDRYFNTVILNEF